jgi:hypothetical protein
MSDADLKLMREGLVRLYSLLQARGDTKAAEQCIACAQVVTNELRPRTACALLRPA